MTDHAEREREAQERMLRDLRTEAECGCEQCETLRKEVVDAYRAAVLASARERVEALHLPNLDDDTDVAYNAGVADAARAIAEAT